MDNTIVCYEKWAWVCDSAHIVCSYVKSIALFTRMNGDKWYLHVNISSLQVSLSLERDISVVHTTRKY